MPQTPVQPVPPPRDLGGGNPNQLRAPTNTGLIGALGPHELPIDRMVDLAQRVQELVDENKKLQARIATLEANGLSREQALNEALREVDRATEGVTKARADLQALRAEIAALREKLKKMEKDELENLTKVIQALQQLLEEK